jgi:hypothetical protein
LVGWSASQPVGYLVGPPSLPPRCCHASCCPAVAADAALPPSWPPPPPSWPLPPRCSWDNYFVHVFSLAKLSNNSHFITLRIDGQSPNLFFSNYITEAKKGHSITSPKQVMIQTHHQ